ncbi:hypothetical protein EVAR_71435_1 [Eumeta japonica]|uniref:Uncharacterized protein n=1 Tax=Eumeta variegata TaxID=151549 RepID=A0A4C1SI44_EUMVA|nr:hypothetical protein EVAR_71435_1 [Eumeta japonica]
MRTAGGARERALIFKTRHGRRGCLGRAVSRMRTQPDAAKRYSRMTYSSLPTGETSTGKGPRSGAGRAEGHGRRCKAAKGRSRKLCDPKVTASWRVAAGAARPRRQLPPATRGRGPPSLCDIEERPPERSSAEPHACTKFVNREGECGRLEATGECRPRAGGPRTRLLLAPRSRRRPLVVPREMRSRFEDVAPAPQPNRTNCCKRYDTALDIPNAFECGGIRMRTPQRGRGRRGRRLGIKLTLGETICAPPPIVLRALSGPPVLGEFRCSGSASQ